MKLFRISLITAGLLSMAACAWWMAGRPGLSFADQILFSHALHQENGATCDNCHAGVEKATQTGVAHLPKEEICLGCHEKESQCNSCHTNVAQAGVKREQPDTGRLIFSHQKHVQEGKLACDTCHRKIASQTSTPIPRPSMAICLECHNHNSQYAAGSCLGCHPDLSRLPLKAVAEFEHQGDWQRRHGSMAKSTGTTCTQCHPQTFCADCHSQVAPTINSRIYPENVNKLQIHRGDWKASHSFEARASGATCLRCHKDPNYCESCHAQNGLTSNATKINAPHPIGYAQRGNPAFHGQDARRHIETCAACHSGQECVSCHRVGGIGGNPHPAGWNKSRELDDAHENKMCRSCHLTN